MATRSRDTREMERVLRLYDKQAHKYDREMPFFERLLERVLEAAAASQAPSEAAR